MIWSLSMAWRDESWLSLTPEPERLLPAARAAIRAGRRPAPDALVAQERAVAERLVLRARRDAWEAWLRETVALAAHAEDEETSALVREVVANHDALALGLPGRERWSKR
jgi:hypothetical protein